MSQFSHLRLLFGLDLRSLALFRVLLGLVILGDLVFRAFDLSFHYTDAGHWPRIAAIADNSPWRFSFHLVSGQAWVMAGLFILNGLLAIGLIVGYRTRWMVFICWVFVMSLQHRNNYILSGADMELRLLLFWSMFLPLGARASVDAALNPDPPKTNLLCSAATVAMVLQVMYVYIIGALLKTGAEWTYDRTAVALALHSLYGYEAGPAAWLRALPDLLPWLTRFVFYLEFFAIFIYFLPVWTARIRVVLLLLLAGMHIGFLATLSIGLFPFVSLTALSILVPGAIWDWLAERQRTPARAGLKIYYDEPCGFCRKTCLILRELLLLPATPVTPAQSDKAIGAILERENSWVVVDHEGRADTHWRAMAELFSRSPLFAPLGWLMRWRPLLALGNRVYALVAANRDRLGRWSSRWLAERRVRVRPSLLGQVMAASLAVMTAWYNLAQIDWFPWHWNQQLNPVFIGLRLDQVWNMFAPYPIRGTGWMVLRGELADGAVVDLRTGKPGEPPTQRPDNLNATYGSKRSHKLFVDSFILRPRRQVQRWYAHHLCRQWNAGKQPEKRLAKLSITVQWHRTVLPPSEYEFKPRAVLTDYRCPK